MFAKNDRTGARLYDTRNDPQQRRGLAEVEPTTVERILEEYVLKDAGARCPADPAGASY